MSVLVTRLWRLLVLLAPVLMPSWGFFRAVDPSPRIEYRRLREADALTGETGSGPPDRDGWMLFRPRPDRLSFARLLGRMVWNPWWNESLYLTSLAERLMMTAPPHADAEIRRYLRAESCAGSGVNSGAVSAAGQGARLQYRLVFIDRDRGGATAPSGRTTDLPLTREVVAVSPVFDERLPDERSHDEGPPDEGPPGGRGP